MIERTDAAVEAALRAYAGSVTPDEHGLPQYDMRAALDALRESTPKIEPRSPTYPAEWVEESDPKGS